MHAPSSQFTGEGVHGKPNTLNPRLTSSDRKKKELQHVGRPTVLCRLISSTPPFKPQPSPDFLTGGLAGGGHLVSAALAVAASRINSTGSTSTTRAWITKAGDQNHLVRCCSTEVAWDRGDAQSATAQLTRLIGHQRPAHPVAMTAPSDRVIWGLEPAQYDSQDGATPARPLSLPVEFQPIGRSFFSSRCYAHCC